MKQFGPNYLPHSIVELLAVEERVEDAHAAVLVQILASQTDQYEDLLGNGLTQVVIALMLLGLSLAEQGLFRFIDAVLHHSSLVQLYVGALVGLVVVGQSRSAHHLPHRHRLLSVLELVHYGEAALCYRVVLVLFL